MEEGKKKKKLLAAEEKRINSISTMDDTQKKLYYSMKSENSSLKKKLDDMAQKYENLKKRKYNITNELKLAKRSALGNLSRENITSAKWHESNPGFVHYWLGFRN